jgi:predicted nucleic acid-binding protein
VGFDARPILKLFENNKKVVFCTHTREDALFAEKVPTHFADALHYILAKKHADGLVTFNTKDFPFKDIRIGKPDIF